MVIHNPKEYRRAVKALMEKIFGPETLEDKVLWREWVKMHRHLDMSAEAIELMATGIRDVFKAKGFTNITAPDASYQMSWRTLAGNQLLANQQVITRLDLGTQSQRLRQFIVELLCVQYGCLDPNDHWTRFTYDVYDELALKLLPLADLDNTCREKLFAWCVRVNAPVFFKPNQYQTSSIFARLIELNLPEAWLVKLDHQFMRPNIADRLQGPEFPATPVNQYLVLVRHTRRPSTLANQINWLFDLQEGRLDTLANYQSDFITAFIKLGNEEDATRRRLARYLWLNKLQDSQDHGEQGYVRDDLIDELSQLFCDDEVVSSALKRYVTEEDERQRNLLYAQTRITGLEAARARQLQARENRLLDLLRRMSEPTNG